MSLDNMKYSRIHVQCRDGSKPTGARVSLGFSTGVTRDVFTDRDGVALLEHATVGRAEVYVNGKRCGSFRAPGETAVFLT